MGAGVLLQLRMSALTGALRFRKAEFARMVVSHAVITVGISTPKGAAGVLHNPA
jgi:hypothetical protein